MTTTVRDDRVSSRRVSGSGTGTGVVRSTLVRQRVRTFGVVRPPAAGGRPRQSYGRGGGLERRVGDGRGARVGDHHAAAAAHAASQRRGRLRVPRGRRQLGVHVETVQQRGAHRAAARGHRRGHRPPVDPWVVPLGRVQAGVAVVAAEHQQAAVQLDHVVSGPAGMGTQKRSVVLLSEL